MADKAYAFETNESGQIVRPSLHDGWVAGLIVGDAEARILLEDPEKRRYSLCLKELKKLVASDFREGNMMVICSLASLECARPATRRTSLASSPSGQSRTRL